MISADMTGLTIEFDLITSLLLAMVVLFVGRALVSRVAFLGRLNIPAPSSVVAWWPCSWPWPTACCTTGWASTWA